MRFNKFSQSICLSFFCSFLTFTSCSYQIEALTAKQKIEKKAVTLMVYMAADNDLEPHALANLKAMERGIRDDINVLVLLDRCELYDETEGDWTDTRLFEVLHDESSGSIIKSKRLSCLEIGLTATDNTELDMANPKVLKSFIEFGKSSYPAEKFALIIWGHGSGWKAFAIDDRTDSYMSVKELAQAVREQDLSVIAFDTCFGGVLENLYELKDCAEFTVASPGVTPGSGWNYNLLLEKLSSKECSSEAIAKSMRDSSFVESQIFINHKLDKLFIAFEAFSKELSATVTDSESQQKVFDELIKIKSYCYSQNPCDLYLDVFSMADKWAGAEELETETGLSLSAFRLKEALRETVLSVENINPAIGIHLIPISESGAFASVHSVDYIKDKNRTDQNSFIRESNWWVPTKERNSASLLDKIFYTVY